MTELVHILERTISQNPEDQARALEFLRQACETAYPQFVSELSKVLSNISNVAYVRQAAGLQLKNSLVAKESAINDVYRRRWLELDSQVNNFVKECVLNTIGTESQRPSTAAQCLAAISSIELPENVFLRY